MKKLLLASLLAVFMTLGASALQAHTQLRVVGESPVSGDVHVTVSVDSDSVDIMLGDATVMFITSDFGALERAGNKLLKWISVAKAHPDVESTELVVGPIDVTYKLNDPIYEDTCTGAISFSTGGGLGPSVAFGVQVSDDVQVIVLFLEQDAVEFAKRLANIKAERAEALAQEVRAATLFQ